MNFVVGVIVTVRFAFSGDVIEGLLDVHGSFGVLHDDGMFEGIHLLHRVDHRQGINAVDFRKQCCCSSIELIFCGLKVRNVFFDQDPRLEIGSK